MAQAVQLKNRNGVNIFPVSAPEVIIFPNGKNLSYVLEHVTIEDPENLKFLESTEEVNDVNPTNVTFNTTRKIMSGSSTVSIFPE